MMKYIQVVLIALLITACSTNEVDVDIDLLKKDVESFNQAFKHADVKKLSAMITENYTHTNSSWKAFGREKWLEYMEKRAEDIQSGKLVISTYNMVDVNITTNKNSAFITGKIISEGVVDGEPFKSEIRVSNYWVFENGKWKRAGFHDTKIESD